AAFAGGPTEMMRSLFIALIIAVAPGSAWALDVPKFREGGFLVGIEWGAGIWNLDEAGLGTQVGQYPASRVAAAARGASPSPANLNLHLAYNIKGHASVGVDFTACGWELFNNNRGGGGSLMGVVAW